MTVILLNYRIQLTQYSIHYLTVLFTRLISATDYFPLFTWSEGPSFHQSRIQKLSNSHKKWLTGSSELKKNTYLKANPQ